MGPAETKESWAGPAETKESWAGPAGERTLRAPGMERPLERTLRAPGTQSSKVGQSGVKHRDRRMNNAQKCQPGKEQDFAVSACESAA